MVDRSGNSTLARVSDTSAAASVSIILADYVAADPATKLNIIGGGITVVGQQPPQPDGTPSPVTVPFGIVVRIAAPPALYGTQCSVETQLEDEHGELAALPLGGPGAAPAPLRVGQALTLEEPIFPGITLPRGVMPSRVQWALMFSGGLPLTAGRLYRWRVLIDTDTRDEWTETFFVPVPPAGLVLG
jgi:hypothetical protein